MHIQDGQLAACLRMRISWFWWCFTHMHACDTNTLLALLLAHKAKSPACLQLPYLQTAMCKLKVQYFFGKCCSTSFANASNELAALRLAASV
jgi:hypothetical protein